MNRARLFRTLSLSALVLAAFASCSKVKDTQDYVPSQRGAVQPDAGGKNLTEADACEQLVAAESAARKDLGCSAVTRTCPGWIRPAGGGCFEYSQASVEGCTDLYASFNGCEEFDLHPCLVSAVSQCEVEVPEPPAEGGAGGEPAITPSEAGSTGEAGTTGAAGANEGGTGGV